jgi:phytoene dehydrogenase-like protein
MFDAIVIGSGFGGLHCAALLAGAGRKVLVVEKMSHPGGTGYVFFREGYGFPMGPLSYSSPQWVQDRLDDLGVGAGITYRRNHFQLRSPSLDIVYSVPLVELRQKLKERFPAEKGIDSFFEELGRAVRMVRKRDFLAGTEAARLARISAADVICSAISDRRLRNLLGTMGTTPPTMSMLNLAVMWNAMSVEGIWFPSCGIHGILERLAGAFTAAGGELRLGAGAEEILVQSGRARGVRLTSGEEIRARWVVSNADYKKTFHELVGERKIPAPFRASLEQAACTTSEVCVYLGVDPLRVDTGALRATHLFFQERENGPEEEGDENFGGREIEVCRWSDNAPDLTPPGRASFVLRVGFPYERVAPFRTGEKKRGAGYEEYKKGLTRRLVATAAAALPGLEESVEVMESATPLTYADWGCRYRGSIAGWSWRADDIGGLGEGFLVRTPVEGLLMTGIYAASGLFLGGVPTAMQTGAAAADIVLGD